MAAKDLLLKEDVHLLVLLSSLVLFESLSSVLYIHMNLLHLTVGAVLLLCMQVI